MKKIIAAVIALAFFANINPAHAAYVDNDNGYPVEVLSLDLSFPNNYTVTGYFGIGLGAPSIPAYVAFGVNGDLPTVEQNGIVIPPIFNYTPAKLPGVLYTLGYTLAFSTLPPQNSSYGAPLYLFPSDFLLNATQSNGGTIECVANCGGGAYVTPLPDAFLMFVTALLSLIAFAWWRQRLSAI